MKFCDILVVSSFFGLLLVGGWTGPLWGMVLAGVILLGILGAAAWKGGYLYFAKKEDEPDHE